MADNRIGASFELDIANLQKGLKEAKQSISLTTSEFQKSTAGMNSWQKTAVGLSAKVNELNTNLKKQDDVVKNVREQYELTKNQYGENSKEAQKLLIQLNKEEATYNKIEKQLSDYKGKLDTVRASEESMTDTLSKTSNIAQKATDEFKSVTKTMVDWRSNSDGLKAKIKQLNTIIPEQKNLVNKLEKEYSDLVKSQDYSEEAAQSLRNEWNKQNNILKGLKNDVNKYEDELDDLNGTSDKVKNSTINLKEGFTVLKGAMANLVADGIRAGVSGLKNFASEMITTAAEVKAETSQFEQTFGDMGDSATDAINRVAKSTGILETRLKTTGSQIYAFARSNGGEANESLKLMEEALQASADSAAYYDKSLEESAETLQSFLKGNYANDAALGVSATEFTRNAKASELFGKKFNDLTEIQKQQTLLKMVTDSQKVSGAFGQAARESDGWENVMGNLKETWRQFQAQVGTPFLEALIPIIQDLTKGFKEWSDSVDWDAFGDKVEKAFEKALDGFQWLLANGDKATKIVKLMIAAYAVSKINSFSNSIINTTKQLKNQATEMKLLTGVTKSMTVAQKANTVATNLGAIAFKTFGAAIKANPIGAAITAVMLGVEAFKGISKWIKEATKETDADVIASDKLLKKQKELNKQLNENSKARKDSISDAKEEATTADILFKKLEELNGVQDKTNAQKETMAKLVSELNTLMPDLNLEYNKEKDTLNQSTDAIRENIEAQKELILAKAAQENMVKIAEDIAKAEVANAEAVEKLTKYEKEYKQAKEETQKAEQAWRESGAKYNSAEYYAFKQALTNEDKKKKAYENTKQAVEENEESMKKLNDEYNNTEKYAENMLNKAEVAKALSKLTDDAKKAGVEIPKAVRKGMEEGSYAIPKSVEQLKKLINFDSALQKAGLDGQKIPQSISDAVINGKLSVEDAIKQINTVLDIGDKATEMYNKGASIPKSLADGIKSGKVTIDEANEMINQSVKFDKMLQEATDKGQAVPKNLSDNIRNGKVTLDEAITLLNSSADFQKMVDKATGTGKKVAENLAEQIRDGKMKPQEAIDEMNALTNYNKLVKKAVEAGIDIPNSMQKEIENGKLKPSKAVERMNALISYQDALKKSKLSGANVPEYFSKNILNGKIKVSDANKAINKLIEFQEALKKTGQEGADIPDTLAQKIVDGKIEVTDANKQMNRWIEFQTALETSGNAGVEIPKKVEEGILSGKYTTEEAAKQLGISVAKKLDQKEQAKTSGKNAAQGLKEGIEIKASDPNWIKGVKGVANNVIKWWNSIFQEHSPSRVTRKMGKYLVEGLGIGIENEENGLLKEVKSFANQVNEAFQLGVGEGLSTVRSSINSSLGNSISGNNASNSGNKTQVINFYQTNNSPKSLSRLEIYRQTNNALNRMKGGLNNV